MRHLSFAPDLRAAPRFRRESRRHRQADPDKSGAVVHAYIYYTAGHASKRHTTRSPDTAEQFTNNLEPVQRRRNPRDELASH
jgi:hypothetical protein